jgi:hypothetical protein
MNLTNTIAVCCLWGDNKALTLLSYNQPNERNKMNDTIESKVLSHWLQNSSQSTLVFDEMCIDIWVNTPSITSVLRINRPIYTDVESWDFTIQVTSVRGYNVCLSCAPTLIKHSRDFTGIAFLWDMLISVTNNPDTGTLRDVLTGFGAHINDTDLEALYESSDKFEQGILDEALKNSLEYSNNWDTEPTTVYSEEFKAEYNASLTHEELAAGKGLITLITDTINII